MRLKSIITSLQDYPNPLNSDHNLRVGFSLSSVPRIGLRFAFGKTSVAARVMWDMVQSYVRYGIWYSAYNASSEAPFSLFIEHDRKIGILPQYRAVVVLVESGYTITRLIGHRPECICVPDGHFLIITTSDQPPTTQLDGG